MPDTMEEPVIKARRSGDTAIVTDPESRHDLELSGYGEASKDRLILDTVETLYLVYSGRLHLDRPATFEKLLQSALKDDPRIMTKFLIYRDLRTRGYTVKAGFGFGSDFRVYGRGEFGQKGARYLVFGMNEGATHQIGRLQKMIAEITGMGKEPIIALVDRHGQVIYYRISKMSFSAISPGRSPTQAST